MTQRRVSEYVMGQSHEISRSTVYRYLKKLGLSRKKIRSLAENTVGPQLIAERKRYAINIRMIPQEKLLF